MKKWSSQGMTDERRDAIIAEWLGHAFSVQPMTPDDREQVRVALMRMYEMSGYARPTVVYAASPLVGAGIIGATMSDATTASANAAGAAAGASTRAAAAADAAAIDYAIAASAASVRATSKRAARAATRADADDMAAPTTKDAAATAASVADAAADYTRVAATSADAAVAADTCSAAAITAHASRAAIAAVVNPITRITATTVALVANSAASAAAAAAERAADTFADAKSTYHAAILSAANPEIAALYARYARYMAYSNIYLWNNVFCAYAEACGWNGGQMWADTKTVGSRAGCIYYHKNVAVVCDRPTTLKLDAMKRPHCANGPWLAYSDGTADYAIDGVRVPKVVVMDPGSQSIAEMEGETNEEVRAIRIDRYGWLRYIHETNAECIDYRSNDIEGTKEALVRTRMGTRLLVTCPTRRMFALGVPDSVTTCESAKAWIHRSDRRAGIRIVART